MVRTLKIAGFLSILLMLASCTPKDDILSQNIKLSDLAPAKVDKSAGGHVLESAKIDIYIFEVTADNLDTLESINQSLSEQQLHFDDYFAFKANSFSAGFGHAEMWDQIAEILRLAKAEQAIKVSLFLSDGLYEDLPVTRTGRIPISFIDKGGATEKLAADFGAIVLRIRADKIPGRRGVCRFRAEPVYPTPVLNPVPLLQERAKSYEFTFSSAGFSADMTPDDFIFLWPKEYISQQDTLGGVFFSREQPIPIVRMFLIVCTAVNF